VNCTVYTRYVLIKPNNSQTKSRAVAFGRRFACAAGGASKRPFRRYIPAKP